MRLLCKRILQRRTIMKSRKDEARSLANKNISKSY
nr:MAG TPA: hypothetical protein [Herelleviridae sp.]